MSKAPFPRRQGVPIPGFISCGCRAEHASAGSWRFPGGVHNRNHGLLLTLRGMLGATSAGISTRIGTPCPRRALCAESFAASPVGFGANAHFSYAKEEENDPSSSTLGG